MALKIKAQPEFHKPAKRSRIEEVITRGSNALMQLNEIGIKGLKWDFEQICNVLPQRFRGTCLFNEPFTGLSEVISTGTLFVAEGVNKSICRHEIADQIMKILSKPIDEALVKTEILDKIIYTPCREICRMDDAVRILNEKVPDIDYDFKLSNDGYHCSVSYQGSIIENLASNKKLAKRKVAMEILEKYFNYTLAEDENSQVCYMDNKDSTVADQPSLNRRKNFPNQIQAMVRNGFEKLVNVTEVKDSKRKVLAGIVLGRKLGTLFPNYDSTSPIDPLLFYKETGWTLNSDDQEEILKLITIGSGSKVLPANEMNSSGNSVNDCHAEVVAKRALQLFLHKVIVLASKNADSIPSKDPLHGCDVLEIFSEDDPYSYKLKEDVKFHMYVSTSPCGDSRVLLPDTADTNGCEAIQNGGYHSQPRPPRSGLLRTKIASGEGTIPVKRQHLDTWDRLLEVERLPTMSCSDKICLWNIVGLQGAILSNVLCEPIYLSSITIGSQMDRDHCERALFDRASGVTVDCDWAVGSAGDIKSETTVPEQGEIKVSRDTCSGFRANRPALWSVTDPDERVAGAGSGFSSNWVLGEASFEVLVTGKGLRTDGTASRLCKRSLLHSFLAVFKWLPFIFPSHGMLFYGDMKRLISCPDNAIGALNYRRKKQLFVEYLSARCLGEWSGKAAQDQDCFSVTM